MFDYAGNDMYTCIHVYRRLHRSTYIYGLARVTGVCDLETAITLDRNNIF